MGNFCPRRGALQRHTITLRLTAHAFDRVGVQGRPTLCRQLVDTKRSLQKVFVTGESISRVSPQRRGPESVLFPICAPRDSNKYRFHKSDPGFACVQSNLIDLCTRHHQSQTGNLPSHDYIMWLKRMYYFRVDLTLFLTAEQKVVKQSKVPTHSAVYCFLNFSMIPYRLIGCHRVMKFKITHGPMNFFKVQKGLSLSSLFTKQKVHSKH